MPRIHDNAEVLRALGRVLDEQDATTFEIVNHTAYLTVSWRAVGPRKSQRTYRAHELEELCLQVRRMRQGTDVPVGPLVELLRTLGQEMDAEGVELSSIQRDARRFLVSGLRDGRHYQAEYRTKDLIAIAAASRGTRGRAPNGPARVRPEDLPPAFLGVVLGAPVYAEDGELVGRVVDIRNRYFKVAMTPREEGAWLPAESVASVTRSGNVILSPLS